MSEAYIGEIRMFAGTFAPVDWALCDGQLLSISGNEALFSLIGTTYGGDGQTTFKLPDLRGRIPISRGARPGGSTYPLGQSGGYETATLSLQELPAHNHVANAQVEAGTDLLATDHLWAGTTTNQYLKGAANALMSPNAIGAAGSAQPHDNMMEYLPVNFIISLSGIWPTRD